MRLTEEEHKKKYSCPNCGHLLKTYSRPKGRGVYKDGPGWGARIQISGKSHYLGYFKDKLGAELAYKKAWWGAK